jgi:hypothetical protein
LRQRFLHARLVWRLAANNELGLWRRFTFNQFLLAVAWRHGRLLALSLEHVGHGGQIHVAANGLSLRNRSRGHDLRGWSKLEKRLTAA